MHLERQYLEMMSGMKMLDIRHELIEKIIQCLIIVHLYEDELKQ